MELQLTKEQQEAVERLKKRWTTVELPQWMIGGGGAIVVKVVGESGYSMFIAIETDGYSHS